ncbi:MAG: tetratricopeptide repeat protein [Pseudomonadota bacterium]
MLLPAIVFVLCQGCYVTAREGKAMQRQIQHLNDGMKKMDKTINTNYYAILIQAQEDIKNVQEIIDRAQKNLGENTADFALQIDQLRKDLAAMEGKMDELNYYLDNVTKEVAQNRKEQDEKVDQFIKAFGMDAPVGPTKIPADKAKHWDEAQKALAGKQYELARGLFREYVKKYGDDPLADDAQLNVGLAFLEEGRASKALGELQKVIDRYSESDRMDAVLYHMGEAFFMIKNCSDARTLFKTVINQFPKSPYKKKSSDKIKDILKAPKSICPTII